MIFYYEQNKWFYTTCILYILTFLVRDNIHKEISFLIANIYQPQFSDNIMD